MLLRFKKQVYKEGGGGDKRNKISVLYRILKSAQEAHHHERRTWSLSSGSQKYLSASFYVPNPQFTEALQPCLLKLRPNLG